MQHADQRAFVVWSATGRTVPVDPSIDFDSPQWAEIFAAFELRLARLDRRRDGGHAGVEIVPVGLGLVGAGAMAGGDFVV
jgi:hypothetical protein